MSLTFFSGESEDVVVGSVKFNHTFLFFTFLPRFTSGRSCGTWKCINECEVKIQHLKG